jgi:adenylate cyclase
MGMKEDDRKLMLGDILVERKVISKEDLQEALEEQKTSRQRIGRILIGKGKVSQSDILNALSFKYHAQIKITEATLSYIDRIKKVRIPIRVKLSIFITLLVVIIMSFLSFFYFHSQRDEFITQTVRMGKALVSNLSYNSSVPLLEDDEATLHILLEEISKVENINYAMIGRSGLIKAHTDINRIGQPYESLRNSVLLQKDGKVTIYKHHDGTKEILDFSVPIEFGGVEIGAIHIGISLDSLQKKINKTLLFVVTLTVLIIIACVGVSFYMSTRFSKPIYNLVEGTGKIKNGNFNDRIEVSSNDEIGDLTVAFNDMIEGLRKKEVMQDAFGKYVTSEIVDMILQNPDEKWFEGEIINATVMFADIRDFTSFSEKRDPAEVVNVLNEYFTMATEIIFKYGGHVDKFIGDEIMSVFGAIIEQKGHPAKAVMAAVALQNEIKNMNLNKQTSEDMVIRIGIGINTGELIAGNIGSNRKMEYTVIGDAVNLASRLTRLAGPDEIVISDSVYQMVSDIVIAEPVEPVSVKGKAEPVLTYKVKGVREGGTQW